MIVAISFIIASRNTMAILSIQVGQAFYVIPYLAGRSLMNSGQPASRTYMPYFSGLGYLATLAESRYFLSPVSNRLFFSLILKIIQYLVCLKSAPAASLQKQNYAEQSKNTIITDAGAAKVFFWILNISLGSITA